tara:strand:+ start:27 stop:605 length:579 start_codon:yes stop_codon:yes gene_type:complete
MADDLKKAVTTIRDGLKIQIDQFAKEKGKETAFTARSRDLGITDPNIQEDVSKAQLAKGAMGAAFIAADYFLDPEKYSARNLKNKASIKFVEETAKLGAGYVNRMMPPGLNFELDFMGMNVDEVKRGGRPAVGARYQRPVELFDGRLKGTAGVEAKRYPRGETFVGGNVRLKFAKGGKVKQYSNSPRKPRLK